MVLGMEAASEDGGVMATLFNVDASPAGDCYPLSNWPSACLVHNIF